MRHVTFGTSGWRAILGEDFTFQNVRIVSQAIVNVLKQEKIGHRGLIIGYDSRFLGEQFARTAAEVFAGHGISVWLCDRDTPTPTISYHVLQQNLAGGLNISASHNPPEYNGIKFTPAWGGPALPETTRAIEQRLVHLLHGEHIKWLPWEKAERTRMVQKFDPCPDYLAALEKLVDVDAIRQANLRVVMDPLYGTSRGYLDTFLRNAGAKMAVLHYWRDPYFGGVRPEPTRETTAELQKTVKQGNAHIGLATDGDADRFGVVDRDGSFIDANIVLALLVDYLATTRRWTGDVGRSVATTHLIDRVAGRHGLGVRETPVGFKYLAELLAKDEIRMGGEESAGLSIHGHVPEKDGILACLLVTEMIARTGKTLGELTEELFDRVGAVFSSRANQTCTETMQENLLKAQESPPSDLAGKSIQRVNTLDGCKFMLEDGSWFLFRPSGTEPLVRCYAEAPTPQELEALMAAGQELLHRNPPKGG